MEMPVIAILDQNENYVTVMDNSKPRAIHFFNEVLHTYLTGTACTFDCQITKNVEDVIKIKEGYKLAFRYKQKDYMLTIMQTNEDEQSTTIMAMGVSLEANNTEVDAFASPNEKPFTEYLLEFDPEKTLTVGINEVSDKKLKLDWDGNSTLLARLLSLATKFGAEIEFVPKLLDNYMTEKLIINIYKKVNDEDQGIGQYRPEIKLEYGKNIKTIRKSVDISNLKTAIRPIGKDNMTLIGEVLEEKDASGNLIYFSFKETGWIYSPQSRDRFPSNRISPNVEDRYIGFTWDYDTDNKKTLMSQALARLKELDKPTVTYEVEGFTEEVSLGDTVRLIDAGYNPTLLLEARVSEQEICWTDTDKCKTTFSNYKELTSQVDTGLLAKMQALIDANKKYDCQIISSNGLIFKNNDGTTILTARVIDGLKDVTADFTINWFKDDGPFAGGKSITVKATDFNERAVYRYEIIDKNENMRGGTEVTIANVNDGRGVKSIKDYYATSKSGTTIPTTWQETLPEVPQGYYLWKKTITTYTDGTTSESFDATYNGNDGKGIRKTEITYQAAQNGTDIPQGDWDLEIPKVNDNEFLWTKTVITYTDNTTSTSYSVSKQGGPGEPAKSLILSASSQIMSFTSSNTPTSTQKITFEVKLQNISGIAAFLAVPYIGTTAQPAITLGGSGNSRTLSSTQWEKTAWTTISVTATLDGLSDTIAVLKVRDGEQGEPTGVTESSTVPNNPYQNMLWKCMGNIAGYNKGVIYRWTGLKWETFYFSAENIKTDSLSAIVANLGDVTSGTLRLLRYNGFINETTTPNNSMNLDGEKIFFKRNNNESVKLDYDGITTKKNDSKFYLGFHNQGLSLSADVSNILTDRNAGLDLYGYNTYVDFHRSITGNEDYTSRLWLKSNGVTELLSLDSDIILQANKGNVYSIAMNGSVNLQGQSVNVRNKNNTAFVEIWASAFRQSSSQEMKYSIRDLEEGYLDKLKDTNFKKYRRISPQGSFQMGVILEDNLSAEYKSGEAVDIYSYATFIGKALQEEIAKRESLEKRIEELEKILKNQVSEGTTN
ncbi:phage tail spike protein [Enterococcus alishanensis]